MSSDFKPGDYVITYSGDKGTVKSHLRNGKHLIQLDGMKVWQYPNQLTKTHRPFKLKTPTPPKKETGLPLSSIIEQEIEDGKPSRMNRRKEKDRTNNDYWGQGSLFASGQVWYHGTTKDFDTFETFTRPTFGTGMSEVPLFFSPSEQFARGYARGKHGKVFKVKLRWRKIFDGSELISSDRYWPPQREDLTKEGQRLYDDLESGRIFSGVDPDDWSVFGDSQGLWASILKNEYDVIEATEFKKWLSKHGYDAAYVTGDGEKNVFVSSPSQVKVLEVYSVSGQSSTQSRNAHLTTPTIGTVMLRDQLIRLAYEHPEFREDLLPLLKEATGQQKYGLGKSAGCEKLPDALREQCEKKVEEGKKNDKKASGGTWSKRLRALEVEFASEVMSELVKMARDERIDRVKVSHQTITGTLEGVPWELTITWAKPSLLVCYSQLGSRKRKGDVPAHSADPMQVASMCFYAHYEGLIP